MRITEIAKLVMSNSQMQKKTSESRLPNGSLPPKGHVNPFEDPYMDITGKSPAEWQKTIPVDENVAQQLRNLIKEDFTKRNGMCGTGDQADAQARIIKAYVATLPGEQRLAATYSCEQIAFQEADRLAAKIREQNAGWQFGEPFEISILNETPNKGFEMRI